MAAVVGFSPYMDSADVAYTVGSLDIGSEKIMLFCYQQDGTSGNRNIEFLAYDGLEGDIIGARYGLRERLTWR